MTEQPDKPDNYQHSEVGMVTLQQHIMEQQRYHPTASGEFSWLLSGITQATKIIAAKVRRAGLADITGSHGTTNVQGEDVQKLDVFADEVLIKCLGYRGNVGILASEEQEEPVLIENSGAAGRYVVLFDPLDGSSNIDVNNSVGTIFSVLERQHTGFGERDTLSDVLQSGVRQRAAGYVIYGSSTVLVYTTGQGVHMFTLEPSTGAYILSQEYMKIPETGNIYSVNESNFTSFPDSVQDYLRHIKTSDEIAYTSRYVGSLVADFHRTLLKGGIFLYPQTKSAPKGKLRLMYECNPMSFIVEQAGGMACTDTERVLDIVPQELHQRVPFFIGSKKQVEEAMSFVRG